MKWGVSQLTVLFKLVFELVKKLNALVFIRIF